MTNFISNPELELAFNYVHFTNKNIFLTGKAGTGKTTFLHKIKTETAKQLIVVAPTGVAAINAGGVTIHSFFQLPFGPYIPGATSSDPSQQRRFSKDKINLIKSLDLLVIDEISMVRADLLDGIDEVLRRYKNMYEPFGGVQLLMIGDLHQLPPVVKDEEWAMLRAHYDTAYFFGSRALQKTDPVSIELKHIYRQSDAYFIDLLNKVRNNQMDQSVLDALNSRFVEDFQPTEDEAYITLASHNATAQGINTQRLENIAGEIHRFKAEITGDFPAYSYPTDEQIELKINAQVMFVKNDISKDKLYYNGKIGKVTRIDKETIFVKCPTDMVEIPVSIAEWTNVKYSMDAATKVISEDIIGTFRQYPLKLAWAITIHKSQGLTFERAIIDANAAFAHGQVYVALSRCKTFEGIVLRSRIEQQSVRTDYVVKNYSENIDKNTPDEMHLVQSKVAYQQKLILELFDFKILARYFDQANRIFLENDNTIVADAIRSLQALRAAADQELIQVADKFLPHINHYFTQSTLPEEHEELQARIKKSVIYFQEKIKQKFLIELQAIEVSTDNKAVRQSAEDAIEKITKELFIKNACFASCSERFKGHQYLRAKANAEIDYKSHRKGSKTVSTASVPKDSPHPVLYALLKEWRDNMAADRDVEPYIILPLKSMLDLTLQLPTNEKELKRVQGIGAAKSNAFGNDILGIIKSYMDDNKIEKTPELVFSKPEKEPKPIKPDTKLISFELYQSGLSIADIALERSLSLTTIEGHLAHYVEQGTLSIEKFVAIERLQDFETYFTQNPASTLTEAKAHFGDDTTFGEIKMALAHLKSQGFEPAKPAE